MHIRKGSAPCWHHASLARESIDTHLHTPDVGVEVSVVVDVVVGVGATVVGSTVEVVVGTAEVVGTTDVVGTTEVVGTAEVVAVVVGAGALPAYADLYAPRKE